jgi:DNA-binding SARP family transcriptional activator
VTTSFRPQADGRYLARPRLVDRLPDAPGFVVALEAPYGYGKSVLASQWAARLEEAGWRTTWLAAGGRGPRALIATELGLPAGSPWSALLDLLWSQPTLLVLEDLESLQDHEELSPLLKDVRGLVLLASRGPVPASEMPRLVTSGRLVRLGPDDLGFTDAEAAELFDDAELAHQLWSRANGWPLPLHFASLTGGMPDDQALVAGIRSSLTPEAWDEALVLATLPLLPAEAAVPATRALSRSGYVQLGDAGFRLHALVSEAIVAAHGEAALAAVKRSAERLPKVLYGEALERLGDHAALLPLLEEPRAQTFRKAPETYLRWDALLDGAIGPHSALRHVTAGAAHKVLGRFPEAVARLERALDVGGMTPDDAIFALKELVWSLALVDDDRALAAVACGEAMLDDVDPELAGRFLSDASFVDTMAGRFDAAAAKLERSLAILPAESPFRSATQINRALNRWDAVGDYDGRVAAQTRTLDAVWRLYPSDAPGQCRDLAMLHAWAGEDATARRYLEQALRGERANPIVGLEARAGLAALDGDPSAFPQLLERADAWGSAYAADVIAMYAIDALPGEAPIADARAYFGSLRSSGLAVAAYARRLGRAGERAEALRLLDDAIAAHAPRAYQLYLTAARYSVTRSHSDLDAFLALTTAGARLLPGHVPLVDLPRDRPELAGAYPLADVLASSWNEAIALRLDEVPALELRVLGGFDLRFMGRRIDLTDRQKQLVTLFLLGLSREEVAEAIWPEVDRSKQRNNMGVQFSLLRRAVEPWGTPTFVFEDGLRRVDSDHARVLAALEARDAERVLADYRDPFAPGMDQGAIDDHRTWLREEVVELLKSAAEAAEPDAAERYLTRVLELSPLDEDALRMLLRHLVARGRAREARCQYAAFAERLRDELGLEPLATTRQVLGAG